MPIWVEIILRSTGTLIIIFSLIKLTGKKGFSQLSYFDGIAVIIIGATAALISLSVEFNYVYGIINILIWVGIPFLLQFLAVKNKDIRDFVLGKSSVFIKDGKIMEDNLNQEQYTTDQLLQQLRTKNIFKVADVEFAVLEPSGELNVLPKKETLPITATDLMLQVATEKEPQTVIMDGEILHEPLATGGFNQRWLKTELEKIGVALENVYLGQVDSYGQLTVDLFDDMIQVPSPIEKPMLLATLKKCQADLELFSLNTEATEAKAMYEKNVYKVEQVINKLTPYLQDKNAAKPN